MGGEVEITEHKKCVSLSVQSLHKLNSCSERATVVYFETQSASRGGRKKWALLNFVGATFGNYCKGPKNDATYGPNFPLEDVSLLLYGKCNWRQSLIITLQKIINSYPMIIILCTALRIFFISLIFSQLTFQETRKSGTKTRSRSVST